MEKPRVLFVDDETNVLNAWRRSLKNEPYEKVFANSAKEALDVCRSVPVSVLVTDYCMPDINGLELMYALEASSPQTCKILVSGHATLALAREALNKCNLFRLFEKPCSPLEIAVGIRAAITQTAPDQPVPSTMTFGLAELERQFPGISKVHKDSKGFIVVEDS